MSGHVEIITRPNDLENKAPQSSESVQEMLTRAQDAVSELAGDYGEWVLEDLDALVTASVELRASRGENAATIKALYAVSHEMKGQAGSFDFPLVTQICTLLCRLLEDKETLNSVQIGAVTAHVDAIRLVVKGKVTGKGGDMGKELVDGLTAVVTKTGK